METIRYMTSLLTFYLKGEIRHEQNFVNLKEPNTILGVIPLGSKKESIPINHLSSVSSDFKLKFSRLLWGMLITVFGLILLFQVFLLGAILLLIGANLILTAFETVLVIKTTAGDIKCIPFFIFEKSKAEKAESEIRRLISNRLDDTNDRQQTDRIIDVLNSKL